MNTVISRSLYFVACIFLSAFCFHNNLYAQCTSTGPLSGTVFADDNSIGVYTINSPGNASASDDSYGSASALLTLLSGNTHYLKATGFGFSIPLFANICGIEVEVEKSATGINLFAWVNDNSVHLVKGGTITGNNYATGAAWPSSESYYTYGGVSDLWGTGWTPAEINSPDFGIAFSAGISGLITLLPSARIDHIRITVHYLVTLPLSLTSFTVIPSDDHSAQLQWTVENNDEEVLFNIQRNTGLEWITLHTVPGQINYTGKTYRYTDLTCPENTAFYRLQIRYASGKVSYSGIVPVKWKDEIVSIYPNPAASHIFIRLNKIFGRINCTGIDGRNWQINYNQADNNLYKIDISALPHGTYILSVNEKRTLFIKD